MERKKIKKNDILKSSIEAISLKGKKTLISGAASGIGRAISWRFAEAGSDLLLVDLRKLFYFCVVTLPVIFRVS